MGHLASFLLLVTMVMAGLPTGQVHAHADGDHDHDHVAHTLAEASSDHGDAPVSPAPEGDEVLHAHDACASATALPSIASLTLGVLAPRAPGVGVPAPPPPLAALTPPHRPPIA